MPERNKINAMLAERLTQIVEEAKLKATEEGGSLSEADIARSLKIPIRAFNNYRRGRVPRDLRVLGQIADRFDTHTGWLLGLTNDKSPTIHKSLTLGAKNGNLEANQEDFMQENEVLRALLALRNDMTELRRDFKRLIERVASEPARPRRGRKT